MKNLQQQRVLIIGGNTGMGLAAAQRLALAGAEVFIAGRSQAKLDAALTTIDGRAAAYVTDFTDLASLEKMFAQIGRLDHLVMTASNAPAWGPIRDVPAAALRLALEQKLIGYWQSIQAALPHLRADGSITLLTGAASRTAIVGTAGVAAVNGSITQMAQTLSHELAPIRVNVISPGLVDTPLYDDMSASGKASLFEGLAKTFLVGRVGHAAEIAQAIEFVVSNGFTTGALIDIDGGAR